MLVAVFKIQEKLIFDSSLCLNFYTQHQLWWGEKKNLCLWMINCLKVGSIMAAVKGFHLQQPQHNNDDIFHGTEEWQDKRGKKPTIFISEVFPQQNQLLVLFFWRVWRCCCHTWISLWGLDRTPKTEQKKGHNSVMSVDLQMLICARTFTLWDPFLLVQCTLGWKQGNLRTSLSGNH